MNALANQDPFHKVSLDVAVRRDLIVLTVMQANCVVWINLFIGTSKPIQELLVLKYQDIRAGDDNWGRGCTADIIRSLKAAHPRFSTTNSLFLFPLALFRFFIYIIIDY